MKAKKRFLKLYKKQEKLMEQLKELENNNAYDVAYFYDDDGNDNGYELVFKDKKIARRYDKINDKLARLFDKTNKLLALENMK